MVSSLLLALPSQSATLLPLLLTAYLAHSNPRHVAKDVEKQLVEEAWNKHDSAREALAE